VSRFFFFILFISIKKFSYENFTTNLLRSLHNTMTNQQAMHWDDLESIDIIIDQVKIYKIIHLNIF
jgi:hypothetical protein